MPVAELVPPDGDDVVDVEFESAASVGDDVAEVEAEAIAA